MKFPYTNPILKSRTFLFLYILALSFMGCSANSTDDKRNSLGQVEKSNVQDETIITIVSEGMNFEVPDKIPSGWTTFHYENRSGDTHFFVLEKMPEGKTLEDSKKEVVPVFQEGMDFFNKGESEAGLQAFSKLPEWFFEVVFFGGSGLVSPKTTSVTSTFLPPGYYVMECYVKMPNGEFHSSMGMIDAIEVMDSTNDNKEPEASFTMEVSSENGYTLEDSLTAGNHTFGVTFRDQTAYDNFLGHDVHLVKVDPEIDISKLEKWMNWTDPEAFISPVPEGFLFLGGTQELPAGETAYFKATIEPGKYVLISEIPMASEKNMMKVFTVK